MHADQDGGDCRDDGLDDHAPDPQSVDCFGKLWFVVGIQVTIGQAIDQVSEGKQEEEDQQSFPKACRIERCR